MFEKIKQQIVEGKALFQFSFVTMLGQSLGMTVPLLLGLFFEPDLFGSYSLAKMILFFFSSLLVSSVQNPFIVYANQEKAETGKVNKTFSVLCIFIVFGLLCFPVLTFLFRKYLISFAAISAGDLIFILIAFVGLTIKILAGSLFLVLDKRMKNSLVELTFGVSSLLFALFFHFTGQLNIKTVLLIYFLSSIVVVLLFIRSIEFGKLFPFVFDRKLFGEILNFTKWVMFGVTAVYLVNWGDNLVLKFFDVSMKFIGIYNLGYQFFKGFTLLTLTIGTYFLPFISQNIDNKVKIRAFLYNKRPKVLAVVFLFVAIAFVAAPLLEVIYPSSFEGVTSVFRILLIGTVIVAYNCFYGTIFLALKKYKFQQITSVIQIVSNVILNVILIPEFGIKGAAIATVLAYIITTLVREVYFIVKIKKVIM